VTEQGEGQGRGQGFESVGDILRRTQTGASNASSPSQRKTETRTESHACQECGQGFEDTYEVVHVLGRALELKHRRCPACQKRLQEEEERQQAEEYRVRCQAARRELLEKSELPWRLQKKTFADFIGRSRAQRAVREFAENFPLRDARGYGSIVLYSGENGVGKSHLAAAAANFIIERWPIPQDPGERARRPVLYHTGPGLLLRIRATYNIRGEEELWRETELDVYNSLCGVPLLILDDVGKETTVKDIRRVSEHTQKVYFHIIDDRYTAGLPVFICSNYTVGELELLMGKATVSRLYEMTQGQIYEMKGTDYRKKIGGEASNGSAKVASGHRLEDGAGGERSAAVHPGRKPGLPPADRPGGQV
jgi:DNA replication protein DnaC